MKITGKESSPFPLDDGRERGNRIPEEDPPSDSKRTSRVSGPEFFADMPPAGKAGIDRLRAAFGEYSRPPVSRFDGIDIASDPARAEKIARIRHRLATGYYHAPEHIEKLADILLEKLNLLQFDN